MGKEHYCPLGPAYFFSAHLPAHRNLPKLPVHVSSLCRCQRHRVQTVVLHRVWWSTCKCINVCTPSTSAHLLPSPATFQHVLMPLQAVGCHVRGVETVAFAEHIDQCMPTEFQWYHARPLPAHQLILICPELIPVLASRCYFFRKEVTRPCFSREECDTRTVPVRTGFWAVSGSVKSSLSS